MTTNQKPCSNNTPPWFVGHWREWHRGHGCAQDDGKPRSEDAKAEIEQHAANEGTGFLTDAELRFLRAATTSGDTLRVRALDELAARRAGTPASEVTATELNSLRGSASATRDSLLKRAVHELTAFRSTRRDGGGGSAA
jgi:hypothetical protein